MLGSRILGEVSEKIASYLLNIYGDDENPVLICGNGYCRNKIDENLVAHSRKRRRVYHVRCSTALFPREDRARGAEQSGDVTVITRESAVGLVESGRVEIK